MSYSHLQAIRRDLSRAGVNTVYEKGTASRQGKIVFFEGDGIAFPYTHVDGGFNITINWSNASNGESFGATRIYLVLRGETKIYSGWGYNAAGSFSQGLDIIKAEFKGAL
jgi:hypothetical protein